MIPDNEWYIYIGYSVSEQLIFPFTLYISINMHASNQLTIQ